MKRAPGDGSVYKNSFIDRKTGETRISPTWMIAFYHDGKKIREATHTENEREARRILADRLKEIRDRTVVPTYKADKITFADLRDHVIRDTEMHGRPTFRVKISCGHLERFFGAKTKALDLGPRVSAYIEERQKVAMDATIAHELATLGKMFSVAIREKVLQPAHRPHIPTLAVDNARQGFFTTSEVDAVCAHLAPEDAAVIRFLYLTGWRKGEILGHVAKPFPLTWAQIDFEVGEVRLAAGRTKNKQGRSFPFDAMPALRELLDERRAHTTHVERTRGIEVPHVFHRDDGSPVRDIRRVWATATRKAGLPGRLIHDLRRSSVMNMERAGVPRSIAMSLSGHKTESIYRRYAIASAADQRVAVAKISALLGSRSPEPTPGKVIDLASRRAG